MKKWLKSFVALTLAFVMILSCMNLSLSESGTLLDDNITVSDTGDDVTIGDTIGDNTTGDDTTGDDTTGDDTTGDDTTGDDTTGDDTTGDDTTGDDTTGDDTTGDDTTGDDTTGDDTTGDDTTGDDTTGDDTTGDDTTGDDTTGDDTTGDDTTGDDTTGDDTTGDDTTGDDTTGDDTTGDDTTGDDTTGDDTTGDDNTGDNDPEVVKTIASATVNSAVYNAKAQKPVVTVKDSEGATLTAGTDYTVSGEFKDAGEYTITIQGIGDYADSSLEKSFVIEQAEFSGNVSATLSPDNGVFTGEKHTPKVTVTGIGGETLAEGTDYECVIPEIYDVDEYTIQVKGLGGGNYTTGTLTATYKVTATGFNATTTDAVFNNGDQKPVVTVTSASGAKMTEGTDYTVTMDDQFVDAKSYKITVTGNGNYAGTKELTYTIKPYADFTASLETAETVYNAKDQKPVVKVMAFEKNLVEGTDYTVTMDDQFVDAKEYTITVTGKGNYTGTQELTYTIKPYAGFTASLEKAETVYNAQDQKPVVKVKAFEKELTEGTDYTVAMDTEFVDAKTYTITVTGKGNYSDTQKLTYNIKIYEGTLLIEGLESSYVYNGDKQTPEFTVKAKDGDGFIVDPKFYDVKWSDNVTDVGEVTVTVTGKGNCEGASGSSKFDIIPDESPLTVTLEGNSLLIYNGEDQKPAIKSKSVVNEKGLTLGADEYTVIYPDDVKNAGDKTVTVKGVGNFEGATGTVEYVIDPYELTEANVEYTDAFIFNGGLLQPDVKVTYGGTGEVEYTIELPESIKVNNANETYQGKVTGQHNFTGTVDVVYTINWLGTPDNAITLVGTLNEENGWYYGSAVECTPAAGYTLVGCKGGDHVDCVNNTVALTNNDGDGVTNTYHLKNGSGQLTAPIAVPPYKQDTKTPQYTVKMNSNSSAKISVTASDEWTGAVIKLMYNGKEEALVDAGIDGRNQEIVLDYTVVVPGEYELRIYDHAGNEIDFGTTYKQKYGDNDGDGLADAFEAMWGSDVNLDDTDADGLSDKDEYYAGTEPTSVDSDGDGLTDAEEVVKYNTDPRSEDGDKDGIKDIDSVLLGNYYANDAKKAPTALNIGLNNKLNKTAGILTEEELSAAVKTLEENGYLTPAAANSYENYNKTNVEREDGRVNMTKGADMRMVNADAEKGLIYGVHVPTGLFAAFELSKRGDLEPVSAISLPEHFGVEEVAGVSVVSDDNASIFVIGNWDEAAGKAVSDLIVYLPGSDVVWTIADTEGASRFDVSPDGRMIAYVMDGKAYVLDLITGNPLGLYEAQCDMLAFTADGKLITSIKDGKAVVYTVDESTMELARSEEAFSGVIHEKQPTMNGCVLKLFLAAGENELMPDGGEKEIATNGHVTSKNRLYSLAYMTNGAKRATDFRFVFGGK